MLALMVSACTAAQKRPAVATALDNAETRHESFEATLRVLDEHPEYVDEMFAQSLHHPPMFDRLLDNTTWHLTDEAFARRTATHLAREPEALRMTLLATLIVIQDQPEALGATADAIQERPDVTVKAMVQRETTVRRTVHALVAEMQHNPRAQRMFVDALRENSEGMAAVLTANPDAMTALFKAIGKLGLRHGSNEFQAFLSELKD
jgi:hypothetical protein